MNKRVNRLTQHYSVALRKYLADEQEAVLAQAYELGRQAVAWGLGVLDMARIHQRAIESSVWRVVTDPGRKSAGKADTFFLESLSPFEVTHRGFRETNVRLKQVIATLEKRNRQLAETNREVQMEIRERKRTEKALKESERRYSTLIETAEDVIFSLTSDGRIAAVNRAFEAVTGWPRRAWLGKPYAPLIHRDDVRVAVERFEAIMRGMPPERREYRVRKADGSYAVGEFTLTRETKGGRCVGIFGIGRDITRRKAAEEALRESEENFRSLSNQVLNVQEEERKRISRELHDEVGQALMGISMNLESLKQNGILKKSPTVVRKLADTQNLLQTTMETAHRFARELRPAMLDELGLLPALRSCLKGFANRTGLRVHFRGDPIAENLKNDQKTVVFRVAQESLTNVGKHAHASQVKVTVGRHKDGICMEIADNGRSFTADASPSVGSKKRLGLLGMQERVRLVNGEFTIKPLPGRGTTIRVVIPFNSAKAPIVSQPALRARTQSLNRNP